MINQLYNLYTPSSWYYYIVAMNNKNRGCRQAVRPPCPSGRYAPDQDLYYGLVEHPSSFSPNKVLLQQRARPIEYNPERRGPCCLKPDGKTPTAMESSIKRSTASWWRWNSNTKVSAPASSPTAEYSFRNAKGRRQSQLLSSPREFTVLIDDAKKRDYELYSGAWAQDPVIDDPKQLWHSEAIPRTAVTGSASPMPGRPPDRRNPRDLDEDKRTTNCTRNFRN